MILFHDSGIYLHLISKFKQGIFWNNSDFVESVPQQILIVYNVGSTQQIR